VEQAAALWVPRETNFQNQGAFSRNNSQNNKQQQQQQQQKKLLFSLG